MTIQFGYAELRYGTLMVLKVIRSHLVCGNAIYYAYGKTVHLWSVHNFMYR